MIARSHVPRWLDHEPVRLIGHHLVFAVIIGIYLCYLILEAQNQKDCKFVSWSGRFLVSTGFMMAVGLFGVATNPTGE